MTRTVALVLMSALVLAIGCSSNGEPEEPAIAVPAHDPSKPAPPPLDPVDLGAEQQAGAPAPSDDQIALLREAVESSPDDVMAARRLAVALFDAGAYDEAIELFKQDAQRNPGVGTLLNLGRAYRRAARFPEAEATYNQVLQMRPNHPNALDSLGIIAFRRAEYDRAIALYSQAVAVKPDYVLASFHLAEALKEAGRDREAYEAFARVVSLEPTNSQDVELVDDSLYEMASLDLANGATQRAAEILEELIRANPQHRSAHYAYGQALKQLGRDEEAAAAFETHMRIQAALEPTGPMAADE